MLTTAQSQYNMIKSNVQNFSVKTVWQTELNKIKSVSVPNTYGETNGFSNALNLNSQSAALMAWTNSKIGLAPETNGILSTQTVGNSFEPNPARDDRGVGYRFTRLPQRRGFLPSSPQRFRHSPGEPTTAQLDGSSSTNSEVEQLNLLNAAQAQQLNEQQSQGVLHACLAQQMTIQTCNSGTPLPQDLNTWGFVQAQHTLTQPSTWPISGTWTTYLP